MQRVLDRRVRPELSIVGGALAGGLVCTTLSHPADTLKTRVQGAALEGPKPSASAAMRSLLAVGGVRALFSGFGWRFGRNVLTVLVLDRSRQLLAPAIFGVECD